MSPQTKRRVKSLGLCFLAVYAAYSLLPAGVWAAGQWTAGSAEEGPAPAASPAPEEAPAFLEGRALPGASSLPEEGTFTLYDTATGETLELTAAEFLPAALACEMDLSAPDEALKAQAVALYSFYSYQRDHNQGDGADFACDTANWLVYAPPSAMEERWGGDFSALWEKLEAIAASVEGQVLTWEGEAICAAFCAISGGGTASSESVWGQDLPYLQAVASPGDAFAPGYLSTVALTPEELRAAATAAWGEGLDFSGPAEGWVTYLSPAASGYVESVTVGGKAVTGEEMREAFGLRSACFQLAVEEGMFRFTVRGWGHGVGMSQAGAAFLARQGMGYREILAHYYPGAALEGA